MCHPHAWLRRVFVGTILDLDPLAVTPGHTAAVAAALPGALQRLTRKQYHRICATYGMAGIERQPQGDQADETQRTRVTIRNSVRGGMSNLAAFIRERILPVAVPEPTEMLLGDALFWERVDRAGPCWLWQGVLDHGSPTFKRSGKKRQAWRYVYELYIDPIPLEHRIVASCESDRCVHPEHIAAIHASEAFGIHTSRSVRQS